MEELLSYQDFASKIKEKYPQYKNVDDLDLAKRIVEKYPQYKDKVKFGEPKSELVAPAMEAGGVQAPEQINVPPGGVAGVQAQEQAQPAVDVVENKKQQAKALVNQFDDDEHLGLQLYNLLNSPFTQEQPLTDDQKNEILSFADRFKNSREDISKLSSAVQNDPTDVAAINDLADLYNNIGDKTTALSLYTQGDATDKNSRSLNGIASVYQQLGRDSEALSAWSDAVKINPYDALAWQNKAYLNVKLGDYNAADEDIDKIKKSFPDDSWIYALSAVNKYKQGNDVDGKAEEAAYKLKWWRDAMLLPESAGIEETEAPKMEQYRQRLDAARSFFETPVNLYGMNGEMALHGLHQIGEGIKKFDSGSPKDDFTGVLEMFTGVAYTFFGAAMIANPNAAIAFGSLPEEVNKVLMQPLDVIYGMTEEEKSALGENKKLMLELGNVVGSLVTLGLAHKQLSGNKAGTAKLLAALEKGSRDPASLTPKELTMIREAVRVSTTLDAKKTIEASKKVPKKTPLQVKARVIPMVAEKIDLQAQAENTEPALKPIIAEQIKKVDEEIKEAVAPVIERIKAKSEAEKEDATKKEKSDAVQKSEAKSVDARNTPADGGEVGKGNAKEETSNASEEEKIALQLKADYGEASTEELARLKELTPESPAAEKVQETTKPKQENGQEEKASRQAQEGQDDGLLTNEESAAQVFAAPFYDREVSTVEDASKIEESAPYREHVATIKNTAAALGVKVKSISTNIGGYTHPSGKRVNEISSTIQIDGSMEQARELAAMVGALAPEVQQSTIASRIIAREELGGPTHTANQYIYKVSPEDFALALKAVQDAGLDYTANKNTGEISLLDFQASWFDRVDFANKLRIFVETLDNNGIIQERRTYAVESDLIEAEHGRPELLERIGGRVQLRPSGSSLSANLSFAKRRNQEFIRSQRGELSPEERLRQRTQELRAQHPDKPPGWHVWKAKKELAAEAPAESTQQKAAEDFNTRVDKGVEAVIDFLKNFNIISKDPALAKMSLIDLENLIRGVGERIKQANRIHGDIKRAVEDAIAEMKLKSQFFKSLKPDAQGVVEEKIRSEYLPKQEAPFEREPGKKSVESRVVEGTLDREIKQAVEMHGLNYSIEHHPQAESIAQGFINEVGVDAALRAVRDGKVNGGAVPFVWAQAIDTVHKEFLQASGEQRVALADKEASLWAELGQSMREKGQSISAMQAVHQLAELGYKLGPMVQRARDAAKRELTSEERTKFEDISKRLDEVTSKLDQVQVQAEAAAQKRIGEEVDRIVEEIYKKLPKEKKTRADKAIQALDKIQQKLRAQTYADPTGATAIIDAGISMIKAAIKAGVSVADAVEAGIDEIRRLKGGKWEKEDNFRKDVMSAFTEEGFGKEPSSKEALDRFKAGLVRSKMRYERKLREKDFARKKRSSPEMDDEAFALLVEKNKLKEEVDTQIEKLALDTRSGRQKFYDGLIDILSVPKSLMASADMSAPLRQGFVLSARHPRMAARSFGEMIRQAFSEDAARNWMAELKSSREYYAMKKAGLYLAEPTAKLSAKEEQFISNIAHRIKWWGSHVVKPSERAYTAYLNRLRVEAFGAFHDAILRDMSDPAMIDRELASYAEFVNNATGRGKLELFGKNFDEAGPLLNMAFFSPKYVVSRFNLLNLPKYAEMTPAARRAAIGTMMAYLATAGATLLIAAGAGANVELDPRSSDFGKIRVGNTRFDIGAGLGQAFVLLSRLSPAAIGGGRIKTQTGEIQEFGKGGFGAPTRGSTILRFGRSKLSPSAGIITDIAVGKDFNGNEVTVSGEVLKSVFPLWTSDILNVSADPGGGVGLAIAAGLASFFGIGVQNYSPKKKKSSGPTPLARPKQY